jgi:8-oxo-dGTP diphosphatase
VRAVGFTPIIGTLGYLLDPMTDEVLLIRRDARPDDDHFGKVNGLGGKVEVNEDIATSMRREIQEESSLDATKMSLRGTITFTNFGPNREEWLIFVFLVTSWTGTCAEGNHEGSLEWVSRSRLLATCQTDDASDLPMWPGDRHFVPLVFDDDPRAFHATMPYDADVPVSWSHVRL